MNNKNTKSEEAAYDLGFKDGQREEYKDGFFSGYNTAKKDIKETLMGLISEEEDVDTMLGEEIRNMRMGRNALRKHLRNLIANL